jgi:type I restriction enzyme R subunit
VGGFGGVQEPQATYGRSHKGLGWRRIASADFPRQHQDVLVEPWVSEALIRLNPEIAAQPDRADEALYKLRAIVLSVRSDGLIPRQRGNDGVAQGRTFDALRPE